MTHGMTHGMTESALVSGLLRHSTPPVHRRGIARIGFYPPLLYTQSEWVRPNDRSLITLFPSHHHKPLREKVGSSASSADACLSQLGAGATAPMAPVVGVVVAPVAAELPMVPAMAEHAQQQRRREGEISAHDLSGCWFTICPIPLLMWWYCYNVQAKDDDTFTICAYGGTLLVVPLVPASSEYQRSSEDPTKYTRQSDGLCEEYFIVQDRSRLRSDKGCAPFVRIC